MDPHVEEQYLRELLLQAEFAVISVGRMNGLLREQEQRPFFRELHTFLSHAAAISRLLWPPRKKAARRGAHLRAVLSVQSNHALQQRRLRDHLEHFDERLDRWALHTTHGTVIDMNIGPVAGLVGGPAVGAGDFIKNFDPSTNVFTFRGDSFDVQAVVDGVTSVRAAAARRISVVLTLMRTGASVTTGPG